MKMRLVLSPFSLSEVWRLTEKKKTEKPFFKVFNLCIYFFTLYDYLFASNYYLIAIVLTTDNIKFLFPPHHINCSIWTQNLLWYRVDLAVKMVIFVCYNVLSVLPFQFSRWSRHKKWMHLFCKNNKKIV